MKRIGISADLSPNGSIHQDTFIRAIKMAEENLKLEEKGFELIWENDFANAQGGSIAAKNLLDKEVDAVVGHYASAAAKNALKAYANKIPVFLPAATADKLTMNFKNAYRICGKDSDLALYIKNEFLSQSAHTLYIDHDGSTHGIELSTLLEEKLKHLSNVTLTNEIRTADKIIYVGNYSSSITFIEEHTNVLKTVKEIYFTDDLVRPELPKNLNFIDQKVYVFGYEHASQCKTAVSINNQYYQEWGEYPLTYFLETYAAMQIVEQLLTFSEVKDWAKVLKENSWNTSIGKISFDTNGDSNFKRFAKWSVENTQLVVVENYN